MSNEKCIQNGAVEKSRPAHKQKSPRASAGKIARLPADIRQQLNLRLFDGKSATDILPWLNDLPEVKEALAAGFAGAPVNKQNLSNWRTTGFQRWQAEQRRLAVMKERGQYATSMAEAAGPDISRGAAASASQILLELLDENDEEKIPREEVVKIAAAASDLLKGEQNAVRLKIAQERLRQHEVQLLLMRDKIQRDDTAIGLRVLGNAQAEKIAAAPVNNAIKLELLGRDMFGFLWEPRPVPASPPTDLSAIAPASAEAPAAKVGQRQSS